jgi:hypothetical protein
MRAELKLRATAATLFLFTDAIVWDDGGGESVF